MKTLYERMTKEDLEKIDGYKFHFLRADIIDALKTNYYWSDLTLIQAVMINDLFFDGPLDITNISKLFDDEKRDKDASPK